MAVRLLIILKLSMDFGESMNKNKKELRKYMTEQRSSFSKYKIEQKSKLIIDRIKKLEVFTKSKTILSYINTQNEVITAGFISECITLGKAVYLPAVLKENNQMEFYRIFSLDTDICPGCYGIFEPMKISNNRVQKNEIDIIIVPGVAFDLNKNRLGYGKGYYDRFLQKLAPKVVKIGLGFDFQIIENIPVESFDIRMDIIITETKEY